ncbi:TetR/AcrR family transcriptional regulator [Rhodococcus sp. IEGM 248]|nr:TetR/AcrR family transcriptional regulator [Rhodococcus sp. IEGM 248]
MKKPLTRDRIAQAGIAIADAEGIGAVSMRRVAAALAVSTMASYRHVKDRDDLVVAMVDAITGQTQMPTGPEATWREMTRTMALADWHAFAQHPWLIEVWSTTRRRMDMASLDQLELVLESLERAGMGRTAGSTVIFGVAGLTLGMAALMIEDPAIEVASGMELGEWRRQVGSDLGDHLRETHGRATRFMSDLHEHAGYATFVEVLESFLDGVAARHGAAFKA